MSKLIRDKVFICYSHKDKEWLERLQTMIKPLVRTGEIVVWDEALVGFQGRGCADGVQPDFGHALFLEALIFQ